MTSDFVTVPDELIPVAEAAVRNLRDRGFTVRIEQSSVEFPSTPTIVSKRQPATHYVFVKEKLKRSEIESWLSFCKSCTEDVRIAIFLSSIDDIGIADLSYCRKWGIGVHALSEEGQFECLVDEVDLAFQAELPRRSSLGNRSRRRLGTAYDRFEQGSWREGFEDAVKVLEEDFRAYLVKQVDAGRNKYVSGRRSRTFSKSEIRRMPLGALKDIVCNLISQNSVESKLCAGVSRLNPTRIARIHNPSSRRTEATLRRRVGMDMWIIVNLIKELHAN